MPDESKTMSSHDDSAFVAGNGPLMWEPQSVNWPQIKQGLILAKYADVRVQIRTFQKVRETVLQVTVRGTIHVRRWRMVIDDLDIEQLAHQFAEEKAAIAG